MSYIGVIPSFITATGILTKSSHALHNRFIVEWVIDDVNPDSFPAIQLKRNRNISR